MDSDKRSTRSSSLGSFSSIVSDDLLLPARHHFDEDARPQLSFLDFPDEVRNRIYKLAIYDHDRGAVFLPRAVPHKVTLETDLDIKIAEIKDGPDADTEEYFAWPVNDGGSLAAGILQELASEPLDVPNPELLYDLVSDDDEMAVKRVDRMRADRAHPLDSLIQRLGIRPALWHEVNERRKAARDVGNDSCDEGCGTEGCGSDSSDDEHEIMPNEDPESHRRFPTEECLTNSCADKNCDHCGGNGLDFIDWYEDHCDVDTTIPENDDEEHQDVGERNGMLYEPMEPPILLACKEIREQCLPVYFATNSFSWRFLWQDYPRSLSRFRNWASSLWPSDARAMKRLTFEGRHTIEEGVEFVADIDLVEHVPYFKIEVSTEHVYDFALEAIHQTLENELKLKFLNWLSHEIEHITFTRTRIAELGAVFVNVMQREPNGATVDGDACEKLLPTGMHMEGERQPSMEL